MKLFNIILAVLFAVFAIVQYNDPDPWLWILIYTVIALISGFAAFGKYHVLMLKTGIIGCVIGLAWLMPSFIDWLSNGAASITGSMKAESPHIELVREFLGLVIVLLTLAFHIRSAKKIS